MKPNEIIAEINKLELSEKLILVEDIWDQIARTNMKLPMPEWQKIELDVRLSEYKENPSDLSDWNAVHTKIRSDIE